MGRPMVAFRPDPHPRVSVVVVATAATGLREGLDALAVDLAGAEVGAELSVALAVPDPAALAVDLAGVDVVVAPAGRGWAAAVNAAAGAARGELLVLLDGGALVRPGWLAALLATVGRRPGCGIVAGRAVEPDGTTAEAGPLLWADGTLDLLGGTDGPGPFDFERPIDASGGAALLVRRDVWEAAGGIDGVYGSAVGAEKLDLCLRASTLGWRTWYQPAAVAVRPAPAADGSAAEPGSVFADRWSELLAEREPPGQWERALWRVMGQPLRALVIDDELPDPRRGSGYGRMHDVLAVLDEAPGVQVTFHPRLHSGDRPVAELAGPGTRVVTDLAGHLASDGVGVDVVVVSRPSNAGIYRSLIDRHLPGVPVVYDAEALFFRRLERQGELASGVERASLLAEAAESRALEAELAAWADRCVTISEDEAAALRRFTAAPVHVVGPRRRGAEATPSPFEQRQGACLVAGWAAGAGSPNADGLRWFARDVLPRVRAALPGFRLLVSGNGPPADVTWAAGPHVSFVGGLSDLFDLYDRVRVAISPTRFGAGVKIKSVEAVQHGVPVVATPEAAAGLTPELAAAVWVAADAAGFADALIALLTDRRAWQRLRRAALAAASDTEPPPGVEQWPGILQAAVATGRTERERRSA